MKATAIDGFGTPSSLHDLPVPEPGEGEVLVRVRASSVNGLDLLSPEDDAYLRDLRARDTVDLPLVVVALRQSGVHAVVHLASDGLELADLLVPGGQMASAPRGPGDQLGRAVQATPIMARPSVA
jgi:hypothetical protein